MSYSDAALSLSYSDAALSLSYSELYAKGQGHFKFAETSYFISFVSVYATYGCIKGNAFILYKIHRNFPSVVLLSNYNSSIG